MKKRTEFERPSLPTFLEIFPYITKYGKEFVREVSKWSWKEDSPHVNEKIGLSIASAFFGEHFNGAEEIFKHAQQLANDPNIGNIAQTSQFNELFQVGSSLSEEKMLIIEQMVARHLILKSLELQNQRPTDVDLFIVATSIPSHPDLEYEIAQAAGISAKTPVFLYKKACDSTGNALFEVISGKFDMLLEKKLRSGKPITVTIFSLEDANRLSRMGGDPYSAQLFSTAASAMTFKYHPNLEQSTFNLIAGKHRDIEAGSEALRVHRPHTQLPKKPNVFEAEYLKEPKNGGVVQMDPIQTTLVFKNGSLDLAISVINDWAKKEGKTIQEVIKIIDHVVMHHPSGKIFEHIVHKLAGRNNKEGLGFKKEQLKWVVTEGNAPSVIIPIAMGRQLHDFEPGQTIMVLSYGAGGSYTCGIYRLGQHS